ncbi:hypothetical protein D9M71_533530 [compost metagenome]
MQQVGGLYAQPFDAALANQRARQCLEQGALARAVLTEQHVPGADLAIAERGLELQVVNRADMPELHALDVLGHPIQLFWRLRLLDRE